MIEITNIDDQRILLYRNLKFTPQSHIDSNVFIAEGEKTTKKLLESNLEIISFFALSNYYDKYGELIKSKAINDNKKYFANKDLMNKIVGFKMHQGIMAIAKQPLKSCLKEMTSPIVVMNEIINSENVGAIIRNAVAFNISSIIRDSATSSPFLRRAVRVSMGTVFNIKYYCSNNLIETLIELKARHNYKLIAIEINNMAKELLNFKFPEKTAIIFGSEGKGIDESILNICDDILFIPINSNVSSINVAASSAIVFNDLANQN